MSDKKFGTRLIPFAVINPIYAGWKDDLEVCISSMGMKGIRLYPQYHDYGMTDPALAELVRMARDRGLPVAFDMRMVDSRQRSWLDIPLFDYNSPVKKDIIFGEWNLRNILPVIRAVPDAKYIIVNLANSLDLNDEELTLLRKTDILFDTSGREIRGENTLAELLKRFGTDKFAFGTHSPILDYVTGRLRIESMTDEEADGSVKALLRGGNAKRILGI